MTRNREILFQQRIDELKRYYINHLYDNVIDLFGYIYTKIDDIIVDFPDSIPETSTKRECFDFITNEIFRNFCRLSNGSSPIPSSFFNKNNIDENGDKSSKE